MNLRWFPCFLWQKQGNKVLKIKVYEENTEVGIDYRNDCWFGFKDVRARLNSMAAGQEFHFICDNKMAEKIGRIITLNDGEIVNCDTRLDGVVIFFRKKMQ